MATETPARKTRTRSDDGPGEPIEAEAQEVVEEEDPLEILEPKAEPKVWLIGKPPEMGGTDDEWSRYIQRPLGYMARMRFFALVSKTIATAMKEGGGLALGGGDVFNGDMSVRERAAQLTESDFADAGSFMALAMGLIGYVPEFLTECYAIWLDVPATERTWFRRVINQPYDPEHNRWGLTDDQGLEMIEVFIDQNYADIREFFAGKLPALVKRVQTREKESSEARKSESVRSRP
jgi:hypothetical protein